MIKRIHVDYTLKVDPSVDGAKVQRAFEAHMPRCPVYRSLAAAIEITTGLSVAEA